MDRVQATGKVKKRKASDSHDNERLSKRLSLLNLERNGQKLYVPVEQPTASSSSSPKPRAQPKNEDVMQVDDTKHKVYIYDLDAELSDSDTSDDGKLAFLPDIEKHLRETRIPPSVLANSEGELAGNKQLVLYSVPSSLTVPEEQDSVRKAIIETRARAGARQHQKREEGSRGPPTGFASPTNGGKVAHGWFGGLVNGQAVVPTAPGMQEPMEDDPDAMDLG